MVSISFVTCFVTSVLSQFTVTIRQLISFLSNFEKTRLGIHAPLELPELDDSNWNFGIKIDFLTIKWDRVDFFFGCHMVTVSKANQLFLTDELFLHFINFRLR